MLAGSSQPWFVGILIFPAVKSEINSSIVPYVCPCSTLAELTTCERLRVQIERNDAAWVFFTLSRAPEVPLLERQTIRLWSEVSIGVKIDGLFNNHATCIWLVSTKSMVAEPLVGSLTTCQKSWYVTQKGDAIFRVFHITPKTNAYFRRKLSNSVSVLISFVCILWIIVVGLWGF